MVSTHFVRQSAPPLRIGALAWRVTDTVYRDDAVAVQWWGVSGGGSVVVARPLGSDSAEVALDERLNGS